MVWLPWRTPADPSLKARIEIVEDDCKRLERRFDKLQGEVSAAAKHSRNGGKVDLGPLLVRLAALEEWAERED